ncbi:hypothetical protein [Aureibaculum conchae]
MDLSISNGWRVIFFDSMEQPIKDDKNINIIMYLIILGMDTYNF